MSDEILMNEQAIEAAVSAMVKKCQTGDFLHEQVICPSAEVAHKAFSSFSRQISSKHRPEDIVIDVSADRLSAISKDKQYAELTETGLQNAFALAVSAAMLDNAQVLGLNSAEFLKELSAEGQILPVGIVVKKLERLLRVNAEMRALTVYDDFVNTIQQAETLGMQANLLPLHISRTLWDKMPALSKFSMVGFTRPNDQALRALQKQHYTSNGFYNDIAYLQQTRI